jgi:hypothetical protein
MDAEGEAMRDFSVGRNGLKFCSEHSIFVDLGGDSGSTGLVLLSSPDIGPSLETLHAHPAHHNSEPHFYRFSVVSCGESGSSSGSSLRRLPQWDSQSPYWSFRLDIRFDGVSALSSRLPGGIACPGLHERFEGIGTHASSQRKPDHTRRSGI